MDTTVATAKPARRGRRIARSHVRAFIAVGEPMESAPLDDRELQLRAALAEHGRTFEDVYVNHGYESDEGRIGPHATRWTSMRLECTVRAVDAADAVVKLQQAMTGRGLGSVCELEAWDEDR